MIPLLRGQRQAHSPSAGTAESQMPSRLSWGIGIATLLKTLLQYFGKSLEALPGVAYPGFRDNCSTLNTKTGYKKIKITSYSLFVHNINYNLHSVVTKSYHYNWQTCGNATLYESYSDKRSLHCNITNAVCPLSVATVKYVFTQLKCHHADFGLMRCFIYWTFFLK